MSLQGRIYCNQFLAIGGLHCRHVGGQNKRKFAHKVCIKIAVNSQRRKILLFLSTNMAAMTSHANHQFFQNTQNELEKVCQLFQVAIHFHPGHPQPKMNDTSFCALVGLLLTKLNHCCNVYIHANMSFVYSK